MSSFFIYFFLTFFWWTITADPFLEPSVSRVRPQNPQQRKLLFSWKWSLLHLICVVSDFIAAVSSAAVLGLCVCVWVSLGQSPTEAQVGINEILFYSPLGSHGFPLPCLWRVRMFHYHEKARQRGVFPICHPVFVFTTAAAHASGKCRLTISHGPTSPSTGCQIIAHSQGCRLLELIQIHANKWPWSSWSLWKVT